MRALVVCPEAPYPIRGGGALRSAALLHYLAGRYTLDGVFFREAGSLDPREAIPRGLIAESALIALPRHSRHAAARIGRNAARALRGVPPLNDRFAGRESEMEAFARGRRWDLAVIEHFWCAPYAAVLRPYAARLALDLHNIESVLLARQAESASAPLRPIFARFAASAAALERTWLPRFDLILTASAADAARTGGRAAVYPNTIPDRPVPSVARRQQIVMSANFEYQPNQDGVAWFARHVWPALADRHPDLEWLLLGKNPHAVATAVRGAPRVRATGEIEDTLPDLAASRVAVAPLRSGSGTRLKILEAWMAGVPVVSTTIGAEGLPARHGENLLIADSPEAFAGSVTRLLEEAPLSGAIADRARADFAAQFTWPAGWKVLESLGL